MHASGHIFFLTLAIMFLTDPLVFSLFPNPGRPLYGISGSGGLLALWWMSIETAVYFHGTCYFSTLQFPSLVCTVMNHAMISLKGTDSLATPTPKFGKLIPKDKLQRDAMHVYCVSTELELSRRLSQSKQGLLSDVSS